MFNTAGIKGSVYITSAPEHNTPAHNDGSSDRCMGVIYKLTTIFGGYKYDAYTRN